MKKILLFGLCLMILVSGMSVWAEDTLALIPQEAPQGFTLTFSLNNDGETFSATIPAVENGLYSFDGVEYSGNNKKTDCLPNTSYTGYVKYAAHGEYEESEAVFDTKTSPKLTVKTPVISPDVEGFYSTLTVSLSCGTEGATIYYTTNGTVPTVASLEYTEPFTINASGTIRAIAVKDGFFDSVVASRYYKKDKIYKRPARYNVYIETNGGSKIEDKKVYRNTTLTPPAAPKKEGYVFAGWYADEELTQPFDFSQRIMKSVTLYAKWEKDNGEKQQIVMYIGEKEATVFGKTVVNDVAPLVVNDRTMLPARFIAENLGATVAWEEETKTVTIKGNGRIIEIRIGERYAEVDGEPVKLDSPAFTKNNRTYTPIRFISEILGATVEWDEGTQKVTITKK